MTIPSRQRVVLAAVVAGYISVTVAESLLAPLIPAIEVSMPLGVSTAGLGLALLAGSIAIGNLVGGSMASRWRPTMTMPVALTVAALGSASAAVSGSSGSLITSQAIIGLGSGIFFAPGIQAVGLAAPERRGVTMGIFGVAFSAGLAGAAGIAVLAANIGWHTGFWIASILCVVTALTVRRLDLPGPPKAPPRTTIPLSRTMIRPVAIGTVGTISQYGTVAFMAVYYVTVWDLSPAIAATFIGVARILSIPGKLAVGLAIDRLGRTQAVRVMALLLVATGLVWTTLDVSAVTIAASIAFAAAVSGLFPIANAVALDSFASRGSLLGLYRSLQVAMGAAGAWAIGTVAATTGMRPALLATALIPGLLLLLRRIEVPVPAT